MYLICNLKNKLTYTEIKEYCNNLKKLDTSKIDFIICPSYPYIYNFIDYTLGSQDITAYENDTITGEITGASLKSLLVKYVLIGHVERRKYLNEDIQIFKKKIENANNNDIKVIYCFTDYGSTIEETKKMIKDEYESIKNVLKEDAIIAYEPEWAIGTDEELDYNYITEVIDYIYELTTKDVVYGGSVNDENIKYFLTSENICGFLVSNSALNTKILQNIIFKMT